MHIQELNQERNVANIRQQSLHELYILLPADGH